VDGIEHPACFLVFATVQGGHPMNEIDIDHETVAKIGTELARYIERSAARKDSAR